MTPSRQTGMAWLLAFAACSSPAPVPAPAPPSSPAAATPRPDPEWKFVYRNSRSIALLEKLMAQRTLEPRDLFRHRLFNPRDAFVPRPKRALLRHRFERATAECDDLGMRPDESPLAWCQRLHARRLIESALIENPTKAQLQEIIKPAQKVKQVVRQSGTASPELIKGLNHRMDHPEKYVHELKMATALKSGERLGLFGSEGALFLVPFDPNNQRSRDEFARHTYRDRLLGGTVQ